VASGGGNEEDIQILHEARGELEGHRAAIIALEKLYKEINASWGDIARRNIGVLEYSPPISVNHNNDKGYTEDWATIRLDSAKFKPSFVGNAINLGAFLLANISPRLTKKKSFQEPPYLPAHSQRYCILEMTAKPHLNTPQTVF